MHIKTRPMRICPRTRHLYTSEAMNACGTMHSALCVPQSFGFLFKSILSNNAWLSNTRDNVTLRQAIANGIVPPIGLYCNKMEKDIFLIDRHLSVDAAIQQFGELCLLKGIAVKPVVPATADQLIATSSMGEDAMLFQTAPSCQDSIEILSNQRKIRFDKTREVVVVARKE
jgi:hypothetical protein